MQQSSLFDRNTVDKEKLYNVDNVDLNYRSLKNFFVTDVGLGGAL
jgi:hypothetical protein